ncbi:hypothetical protein JL720_9565 [Aureococcus anophagefferens]|nr:hypothetical protein JL720_9565 [Aureococcus anophagefferens]
MPTTTRDVPPEAQQRQGREELKRWREERIAALASRRRAYRVLQGDLSPKVLHHLSSTDEFLGAEAIADFCLPVGAAVRGAARASDRGEPRSPGALNGDRDVTEVIFVLSGGGRDGSRVQYGLCAHTTRFYEAVDKGRAGYDLVEADVCYCLITRYPFVALHFQVLRAAIAAEVAASRAARAVGRGDDDHRRHRGRRSVRRYAAANLTLRDYAALPVPPPGGRVLFRCARADPPSAVEWTRPPGRGKHSSRRRRDTAPGDEATALAREWSVPVMLSKLTLENVLLVLGCALVELQIVFVSQDLQTLSASALALVSLLRPLRWAGPLISTLPSELYEYLDSPVPLILGVVSLPLHFEQGPDMVLVAAGAAKGRPTSKAPLSAVFHSCRLIFGRATISRSALEAWMLFL